jgi:glycosyltransferase involved in cell wall biosynthesis
MKLSVVIPCLNKADSIAVQLEALATQQNANLWEVIIADNGSTDASLEIAEQYREKLPNFRIVDASDRKGAAHARNVGARAAASDAIVFCDADDEVGPGWVAAMSQALSNHDFVGSRFEFEKLNKPELVKSRTHAQTKKLQSVAHCRLPFAGGSGLGIKRSIHTAVGGFDESMLFCEDTDYSWRVQAAGTTLHFVPEAIIHIRLRENLADIRKQANCWGEYNVLLYYKHQHLFQTPSSRTGFIGWIRLFLGLGQSFLSILKNLGDKEKRTHRFWLFALRMGRLRGCIKYRTLSPL